MPLAPVSIDDLESRRFFADLAPGLPITDAVAARAYALATAPAWPRAGHVALPNVVAGELIEPMANAVQALVARGLHPIFAYVYDAFWAPAAALQGYAERVLGSCALMRDGWAWRVPAGDGHRGWAAHRDDRRLARKKVTVWVALTDTDVHSACIHILPLDRDPAYLAGNLDENHVPEGAAVPLEAKAGTALVWDGHTLHWGGPSSSRARGPRISFSYTFAAKTPDTVSSTLALERLTFEARLDAIASMILRYEHHERMPESIDRWAKMLVGVRLLRQGARETV